MIPSGAFIPVMRTTDLEQEIRVMRSYLSGDGRVLMYRPDSGRVEIIVEGIKSAQVSKVLEMAEAVVRRNLRIPDGATIFRRPEAAGSSDSPDAPQDGGTPAAGNYLIVKKES